MQVFVVDAERNPLAPCHPAVARKLLKRGRAVVLRRYPFTIILKEAKKTCLQDIRLKIDPGSKITGITLLQKNRVVLLQLRILLENSKMVSPSFNLIISSDPSDNMFMECAVCAKANAFITSDYKNDLIRLAIYRSVRICDPATFLREKVFLHLKMGVLT